MPEPHRAQEKKSYGLYGYGSAVGWPSLIGRHFEYWHVHTRATDMPSAMPIQSRYGADMHAMAHVVCDVEAVVPREVGEGVQLAWVPQ